MNRRANTLAKAAGGNEINDWKNVAHQYLLLSKLRQKSKTMSINEG